MENVTLTAADFVFLAVKGFCLGYLIGFLNWALCYSIKVFRKSFTSGLRCLE